ncbi:bifunctional diaminohydroxyphosphoribosylaminopyrimidine deaminase/5-amino-6-(5-phosphoribosylamino)uracil reductase RibD [Salinibacterium sp. NSLL150]|uniref:bifunctional diaminohydroxyphosphoribosylaminopyrimidine deaminase/5-amino-6-(5-phosphoribosylamino)uracil reductase RibD n=1 Tax=unclassified Salinibacterium TaxID=2632331 RepID=UPI0018CECF63|nr:MULTISPECIES: bifunctional diaminohydroxyphosphoribosylaminopyrimidine deaminase/5-amino-6-(5-phosphoribosylamino)uracil reductase RibD [unclassified Salinibacterium]MBH0099769.1 bifunctional diaminohydroxyphosphoribosylaminopyrimidine deaminase/5-amino-6-(5-phosphoribosylamino)uracil reductase RibD [Salinibacterium sp. NSLL35]MBH0102523.1 bifunctional diaminohydroxyphosphoribosylaminopyrimidine deaminase/5-amino-6-(5-phosphoribosylamino)uracil reductase RibD [Salinibacterium sp. NSLL150]MBH0
MTTPEQQAQLEKLMRHALSLASHGPITGGNPQVGCVLVDAAGEIVAEGWHHGAGTPHAEVDALAKLGGNAAGLTAVVTLEPCNHHGRTGPCAQALLDAGVSRVVYAVPDPGPNSGGGAERLRAGGVEVIAGIAQAEAEEFLHSWLTAARLQRPHVTVKWASTLDGRAAAADGTSQWITGTAARQHVHEQRARADAIVVGTGTVLADDPSLTARGDAGELLEWQPQPVVLGRREIPADAQLRQHPEKLRQIDGSDLNAALSELFEAGIRRVFVEGGPTIASAFIATGLADELLIYLAPKLLGGPKVALGELGVTTMAEAKDLSITELRPLGNDVLIVARPAASTKAAAQPAAQHTATEPTVAPATETDA